MSDDPPIKNGTDTKVLIVGGSLSGLTLALACATRGIRTRVLEQFDGLRRNGAALGVDRSALLRVSGLDVRDNGESASFPVITSYRKAVAWKDLYGWLRSQAYQHDEITLTDGITIAEVVQSEKCATAITSEGSRIDAQVIVGADGYQSVVRRAISPDQPGPLYAGYLLWRSLVDEADLPATAWAPDNDGVALLARGGDRLVAYPVASQKGSLRPGERRISFAWYDGACGDLLQKLGCVSEIGHVLSSLAAEDVPQTVLTDLCELALRSWPEPWRAVIVHALEQKRVFATPVAEYLPERLAKGRLVLIGDAAHVASPVTGQGFAAGILDADLLAKRLAGLNAYDSAEIVRALESFESQRLPETQSLVATSMAWSQAFVAGREFSLWKGWKRKLQNKS